MSAERILIVDDEDSIREVVSSMLTSSNFVCTQAQSGKEALALLQSGEEFELMLSDMMMPVMDGEALLAATKERFPDIPVVMVTAMHDISIALNAIRNGAYDYLLKPFDREQLLATVRRALENRRLKLENRAYQTNLEALVTARTEQLRQAITTLEQSYDITLEALGKLTRADAITWIVEARFDAAFGPWRDDAAFRKAVRGQMMTEGIVTSRAIEGVQDATVSGDRVEVLATDGRRALARVVEAADALGVAIGAIEVVEPDLEAVFLHLTGRALRDE